MQICRLLNGLWQVSGAHGYIDPSKAIDEMIEYHDAGFTTWDLADHYGPAEDFIGTFRQQLAQKRGNDALGQVQSFTKWVPRPGTMPRSIVEQAINVSLKRMQTETLDLLQFHWWDYKNDQYLEALRHLADLRDAGKIRHVALTNFDTEHLKRIVDAGIRVVSNQVQFSVIDRRPEENMIAFCQEHDIKLLAYGTFAGGMLSDKYLGQSEPGYSALFTASLRKYKQMIDLWGGWDLFQQLLQVLRKIADKHQVSIANVAARYVLDQPTVAGVIVGVRLGLTDHREDNRRVLSFSLDEQDLKSINAVNRRSANMLELIGDCGAEYRN